MIDFVISMVVCYSILFLVIYILFLLDTAEIRRLHKLSKKDNKKKKFATLVAFYYATPI